MDILYWWHKLGEAVLISYICSISFYNFSISIIPRPIPSFSLLRTKTLELEGVGARLSLFRVDVLFPLIFN